MNRYLFWMVASVLPIAAACGDDADGPTDGAAGAGRGGSVNSGSGGAPGLGGTPLNRGGAGSAGKGSGGSQAVEGGSPGVSGSGPHTGGSASGAPPIPEGGTPGAAGSTTVGEGGASGGAGGSLASAGAGPDSAGAAGAAGAPFGYGEDVYVDPRAGSDDALGTRLEPFKTIHHASNAARRRRSSTIWLLDGTYDASTEPRFAAAGSVTCGENSGVVLPPGIALRAENAGRAELVVAGRHGLCASGGELSGLVLRRAAAGGRVVEATAGSLAIEETTFSSCGLPGVLAALSGTQAAAPIEACVLASGSATVRLLGAADVAWVNGTIGTFVAARDQARVSVEQGTLDLDPPAATLAAFAAGEGAQLSLSGLELSSSAGGIAVHVQDAVTLRWLDGTVSGFDIAGRFSVAGASVSIEDVRSTNNDFFAYVDSTAAGVSALTLRRVNVSGAEAAVSVRSGDVRLALLDSELRENTAGVLFSGNGALTVENSSIRENTDGLRTLTAAGTYSVKLRGVEISDNPRIGLLLGGLLQGTYDLGTVTDPGNNRFTNNATETTGGANVLVTGGQPIVVHAVGNTWTASAQGALADGHYSVSGPGAKLEVTGGTGPNYRILTTPTVLRLAENP